MSSPKEPMEGPPVQTTHSVLPEPAIRIELDGRINFAMQQNDVPVIKSLVIDNPLDRALENLRVQVSGEPGFCEPWEARLSKIPPQSSHRLRLVDLTLSPVYLDDLTERVRGQLRVKLYEGDTLRVETVERVHCLARNEWGGLSSLPEILAAFVLPNHPVVARILKGAGDHLQRWTQDASLSGYQTKDARRVALVAAACFTAIRDLQLRYINPPASFEQEGQKIRLPGQILDEEMGTCLDLALLAGACLEQSGLHPLIVLVKEHVVVGVWLEEESFDEAAHDDGLRLRKRVDLQEVLLFDASMATANQQREFEEVVSEARRHLSDPDEVVCVIDIYRARTGQIRPLPERVSRPAGPPGDGDADAPPARDLGTRTSGPDLSTIPTRAPQEHVTAPEEADGSATRLDRWKRKLLDLSLRNRLLNFRDTKKTIPLTCPDLGVLEDALAAGAQFKVLPRVEDLGNNDPREEQAYRGRTGKEGLEEILKREIKARRLRTDLPDADLGRQLLEVYRAARNAMEEGGVSSLYLAVGFLKWFESEASTQVRLAPILLLPVELHRKSVQEGFTLTQGDDEPLLNVTLLELLRQDHGVTVEGLDPLPYDDSGLDVSKILHTFRKTVRDIDRWDVVEMARIGLFSFAKFLMWRDLSERSDDLRKNPVVDHLVSRPTESYEPGATFPLADTLDREYPPHDVFCPMPADSSQLSAVLAAAEGRSFVLEGPPGTGKSQTITNLVAHCLAEGKTVLFVSEKMAALEVVRKRLERIGLGGFCLELHSNKAHKREVLAQISASLEAHGESAEEEWKEEADRLASLRNELNAYVDALHAPHPSGESVFRATSRLIGLRDVPSIPLSWPSHAEITSEQLADLREVVRHLATAAAAVGSIADNPWRATAHAAWTPVWEAKAQAAAAEVRHAVKNLPDVTRAVSTMVGMGEFGWSRNEIELMDELSAVLLETPAPPTSILVRPNWEEVQARIGRWIEHGRKRDELRLKVFADYERAVLELNLDDLVSRAQVANTSSWPLSWLRSRHVKKELKRVANGRKAPARDHMLRQLLSARELRAEEDTVQEAGDEARDLLGRFWNEGEAAWDELANIRDWAGRLRSLAARAAGADVQRAGALRELWASLATEGKDSLAREAEFGRQLVLFRSRFEAFQTAIAVASSVLSVDMERAWGDKQAASAIETASKTATGWIDGLAMLRTWCAWQRAGEAATSRGLTRLLEAYANGGLAAEDLPDIFERSYTEWWYREAVSAVPVLAEFFSPEHERKIENFREKADQLTALAQRLVRARLAAKVPRSNVTLPNSELGIVKREVGKKRRHMAVRQLFQNIPNLLPRLKPCLLMSPMSVAQYLDAGHKVFDLVVFDEASQIPVWDAVGAIARAKQAVIVGDPKQLPPTSFFGKTEDDDNEAPETELVDDLESILDECIGSGLPTLTLNWHYRSLHESLIAFSNYNYYGNRLLTFPSSQRTGIGVSWRHVPAGVYDKGKSRTNRVEAEFVVEEIVKRLRDPSLSGQSIGVVTFSQAQQSLVEDLLEEWRRRDEVVDRFFGEEIAEPVFVKNLENVQGDERDVILFSVCYGPDMSGRVSMNFGPMNKEGGERRLNVAVTRARREVIVFSTLTSDQIDLSRTRARGVADLKAFLDYARKGPSALAGAAEYRHDAEFDSPFEEAVYDQLVQRGWDVHKQVGCSGYRIDLAVVDPGAPGRYLLGVECDGGNYHRAKTARDRDKLREGVLRGLGWQLHRVWSTDWWTNPEGEVDKIEAALARPRKATPEVPPATAVQPADEVVGLAGESKPMAETLDSAPLLVPPQQRDLPAYKPITIDTLLGAAEQFYEPSSDEKIRSVILRVVEQEGPVSLNVVARRAAGFWGMGRVGRRILDRVSGLVPRDGIYVDRGHPGDAFLWPAKTDRERWTTFRVPGPEAETTRGIDEISIVELANAGGHILRQHFSVPIDDLVSETARVFGFRRTGRKVEKRVALAMRVLVKRGEAREDEENLVAT